MTNWNKQMQKIQHQVISLYNVDFSSFDLSQRKEGNSRSMWNAYKKGVQNYKIILNDINEYVMQYSVHL